LLKESYRINKHGLINTASENNYKLKILFTLSGNSYDAYKELNFKTISDDMTGLLLLIEKSLHK